MDMAGNNLSLMVRCKKPVSRHLPPTTLQIEGHTRWMHLRQPRRPRRRRFILHQARMPVMHPTALPRNAPSIPRIRAQTSHQIPRALRRDPRSHDHVIRDIPLCVRGRRLASISAGRALARATRGEISLAHGWCIQVSGVARRREDPSLSLLSRAP